MERHDKGILIIFEGIDGAGKTTQAARLAQWLKEQGRPIISFSEPTSGPYGRRLREIMHSGRNGITPQEELDLFLKDREEDVRANILPALKQGYIVIMDRYYYSNMAYQGALGIDVKTIETLNEKIAPRPDAVFILEVDVQLGLHRINTLRQEKENHFEKAEYLKRVNHLFSQMRGENIYHIKASLPLEKVNAQIGPIVLDLLQKHQSRLAPPNHEV
ncbi:MAG: dTMP kinase [bacterium]